MEELPGQDESWPAWIAVLAMWTRGFIWAGVTKGLGIMLPTLQEQFGTNAWTMGLTTSVIFSTVGFVGIFAGLFSRNFQPGALIMTCGTMIGAAVIVASFTVSPLQLALAYTLLAATGAGITSVIVKETVARCFTKNYATALGIARTGTAFGLFAFSPLTQLFLTTYGWRGTMLLTGAISLHFVVCGALMVAARIRHTNNYQELPENDPYRAATQSTSLRTICFKWLKYTFQNLELKLLLSPRYWGVAVMYCSTGYTFSMWLVYFVSMAESTGFSPEDAATFVTVAGVGSLVSRVAQGFIVDRGIIPYWVMMIGTVSVVSLSICANPWLTSYWTMMTTSALTLIGNGVLVCLTDVLIKQVMGLDLLAGTFGWTGITAATFTVGLGFLPGWIYDKTGSYTVAFTMIGCVQASALIPLLGLKYFKCVG